MKSPIALLALAMSASLLLGSDENFDYQTTSLPRTLLKKWIPDDPSHYMGRYEGEYGDGGGSLSIVAYPADESSAASGFRYSGCLIGPCSVATRPQVRPFENIPIADGILKIKTFTGYFVQFRDPELGTTIKGILIDNLFYKEQK